MPSLERFIDHEELTSLACSRAPLRRPLSQSKGLTGHAIDGVFHSSNLFERPFGLSHTPSFLLICTLDGEFCEPRPLTALNFPSHRFQFLPRTIAFRGYRTAWWRVCEPLKVTMFSPPGNHRHSSGFSTVSYHPSAGGSCLRPSKQLRGSV
jgi:hypothetical protein